MILDFPVFIVKMYIYHKCGNIKYFVNICYLIFNDVPCSKSSFDNFKTKSLSESSLISLYFEHKKESII